ncbi:MAG: PAC2 family protein, partial [Asgard group archaeon]|nr:PAC2 family protein [Asgard group archaeon]
AEPEIKEKMEKMDIPPLKSGYIGGFAGAILNRTMINEIDGYALLVGTRPNIPDPGGAAKLITKVNDIEDLDIDIKELNKQSESIKKKLQELADQQRKISQQSGEKEGAPSTYYT